jgi:hypothetical protein
VPVAAAGNHAGLAHPRALHLADDLALHARVGEGVGHDDHVERIDQELVAQLQAVVHVGLQDHLGVVLLDEADQARQPRHRCELGHADADAPLHHAGLAELLDRGIALLQQLLGEHEHLLALFGEARGALAAVEELGVEQQLQFVHPLGDGRLRGVQLVGGLREAAELADPVEGFELLEGHHGAGLL